MNNNGVKHGISLDDFEKIIRRSASRTLTITKGNRITFGQVLRDDIKDKLDTSHLALYINKIGSIVVLKPDDDGMPINASFYKDKSQTYITSKEVRLAAESRGIALPCKYTVVWDDDMQGFVGRTNLTNEPEKTNKKTSAKGGG